jgi:hypothetical protein
MRAGPATNLPFEQWPEVLGSERLTGGDPRPADAPLLGDRDGPGELSAARCPPSSQGDVEGFKGGGPGAGGMIRGEAIGRR